MSAVNPLDLVRTFSRLQWRPTVYAQRKRVNDSSVGFNEEARGSPLSWVAVAIGWTIYPPNLRTA